MSVEVEHAPGMVQEWRETLHDTQQPVASLFATGATLGIAEVAKHRPHVRHTVAQQNITAELGVRSTLQAAALTRARLAPP